MKLGQLLFVPAMRIAATVPCPANLLCAPAFSLVRQSGLGAGNPLIMHASLLGIRQHPVGCADELKGLCEARVTVVMVGMKFMAQRFVGRPNHFGWRIACHFQIIVVRVQLLHCPVSDAMIPS